MPIPAAIRAWSLPIRERVAAARITRRPAGHSGPTHPPFGSLIPTGACGVGMHTTSHHLVRLGGTLLARRILQIG